ncbi:hypothetical protein [Alloprevotella tannerae]|uniref:hypothetical protein n=1 Tax=Alloprevotella tannerae TaxID=76122 RepID=UPI00288A7D1D|nr:hypothetical protein [Alloprevotella tannerae]
MRIANVSYYRLLPPNDRMLPPNYRLLPPNHRLLPANETRTGTRQGKRPLQANESGLIDE